MEKPIGSTDHIPDASQSGDLSTLRGPEMSLGARVRSILTQPRPILNLILLLVFSADWIREAFYWFSKDTFGTGLDYWAYTDWLIDYSHGFFRRGFSGEMWRLVPTTISPVKFVAVLSWILILVAAFGYLRLLARSWKRLHPLTLFGLLFLPSLFFFYLHDHGAIARKEILGYITVLLHLLIVEKTCPLRDGSVLREGNLRRYAGWLTPLAVILLPAIILVHEGNFLLFIPLHGMITLAILRMKSPHRLWKPVLWTGLLYLPAVLAFAAVYLAGTPSYPVLLGICEKWAAAGALRENSCFLPPDKLSGSTLPGSFIPMQWSLAKAATITRIIVAMNWEAWAFILPVLAISLWYLARQALFSILRSQFPQSVSTRSAQFFSGRFFRKYFLVPLLFSLPIYLTAYDYGRWFTVTCINFSMVLISLDLPSREFAHGRIEADEGSAAINSRDHLDNRWVFYGVSTLICFLAVILWLPHYCLFSCEIIKSPLEFFIHTFTAN